MLDCVELAANDGILSGVQFPQVSADSQTPYTDATSWYFSQRSGQHQQPHRAGDRNGDESADRATSFSGSSDAAAERVKRPMNAFMVWSQIQRRLIAATTPGLHNAVISKQLGRQWNSLMPEEQQPFIAESIRLRRFHMVEYPSYKYKPRRKSVSADIAKAGKSLNRKVISAAKLRQVKRQSHTRRRASNSCSSSTSNESDASSIGLPTDVREETEDDLLNFSLPPQEFSDLDWNSSFDDARLMEQSTNGGNNTLQLRPSKFLPSLDFDSWCDTSSFDCYSTPEVDALLADDWLLDAHSYNNVTFLDFQNDPFCDGTF